MVYQLKGSSDSKVSIFGQNDEMMEYLIQRSPKSIFSVVEEGIFINDVKAQRLNKTWRNPLVIKIERVDFKEAY